jgi:hypothetical protein
MHTDFDLVKVSDAPRIEYQFLKDGIPVCIFEPTDADMEFYQKDCPTSAAPYIMYLYADNTFEVRRAHNANWHGGETVIAKRRKL